MVIYSALNASMGLNDRRKNADLLIRLQCEMKITILRRNVIFFCSNDIFEMDLNVNRTIYIANVHERTLNETKKAMKINL